MRKSTNKFVIDGDILRIYTESGVEIKADADDYDICRGDKGAKRS